MSDRSEWLDWRRSGIGASDVAGVLGISPWASPYSVWADKMGFTPDDEATEQQLLGLALEPAINAMFHERTGLYVAGAQTRVEHPIRRWMRATLDGFVVESSSSAIEDALGNLEAKTTIDSPAMWEEAIPNQYVAQTQWQMFVTGAQRTWIAALHASFGLKFRIYEVERDEADIAFIVERVTRFWNDHVVTGVPPEVDGHRATSDALRAIPVDPDAEVDLDDRTAGLIDSLRHLKTDAKLLDEQITARENAVKAAMGACTEAFVNGERVATWRTQCRTGLDVKALRKEMPDVADTYTTNATSRVFRLATKKGNQ